MSDYYSILGVPKTASQSQIKDAYLSLARENHPDRFTDPEKRARAEQAFQTINESYNHLRDEKLRKEYDERLVRESISPEEQAQRFYKKGQVQENIEELESALKFYFEAMQLEPENAKYIAAAARVMARDRTKVRKAAELYNQAIAKDPKERQYYLGLGEVLLRSGLPTRARRVGETGLQHHPGDPELQELISRSTSAADKSRRK